MSFSRRHFISLAGGGLAFAMALGRMPQSAAVQGGPVPATGAGPYAGLDQMDGLVSVIARGFAHKETGTWLFNAPADMPATLGMLDLTVASFETADQAKAAIPGFVTIAESHLAMPIADMVAIERDRLAGFAEEAVAADLHFQDLGADLGFTATMWAGGIIAPFEASLIYAHVLGFGIPPIDEQMDLVIAAVKQVGEANAGTGEPAWIVDGTSTGGDWDRLPKADDPVLGGLVGNILGFPVDTALFPEFMG